MATMGLGSNTQLGIGIAIRMYDQYSAQVKHAKASLTDLRKAANDATMGALQDARNRYAGIAAGAGFLTAGLMKANKESATLEHSIRKIAIVGGSSLGMNQKQIEKMVFKLGDLFGSDYADVSAGVFENVKAGVKSNLELVTQYQIAVSKVADEQLGGSGGVASGMLNILGQFHLRTDDIGRIGNALVGAANSSKADISSLNEGMKQFGATAYNLKLKPEEALAMLAKVENAGLRGSMGGTKLNNFFLQAAKNAGLFMSKQKKAAWAQVGIDPMDVRGMMDAGKTSQIIDLVQRAVMARPVSERVSMLNELFNIRGSAGAMALFGIDAQGNSIAPGKNAKPGEQATYSQLLTLVNTAVEGNIAMTQAKQMADDFWTDMTKLKNSMTKFWYEFYSIVKPALRVAYQVLGGIVKVGTMLLDTSIGKVLAGLTMVIIPLTAVVFAFKAAVMGAIYSLNMFRLRGLAGGAGRFGGLVQSGLAMYGMGGYGSQLGRAGVTQFSPGFAAAYNKKGMPYVPAGHSVTLNGKQYTGGKMLPRTGYNWNTMGAGATMASGWGAGATAASRTAGAAGAMARVGGGLLRGAGMFFGKFIPIVGGILTLVSIAELIHNWLVDSDDEKESDKAWDPITRYYQNALNHNIFSQMEADAGRKWQESFGKQFNNHVVVNIDGQTVADQTQQADLNTQMDTIFYTNAIH